VRAFSLDTSLSATVLCEDNLYRTAWDFQDQLWHLANNYVRRDGGSAVAESDEVALILTQWREMLDGVDGDRDAVADRVDWVAKLRVVEGYQKRYDLAPGDARLRAIDLQYHDLRAERSLAQRVVCDSCSTWIKFVKRFTTRRTRRGLFFAASAWRAIPSKSWPQTGIVWSLI